MPTFTIRQNTFLPFFVGGSNFAKYLHSGQWLPAGGDASYNVHILPYSTATVTVSFTGNIQLLCESSAGSWRCRGRGRWWRYMGWQRQREILASHPCWRRWPRRRRRLSSLRACGICVTNGARSCSECLMFSVRSVVVCVWRLTDNTRSLKLNPASRAWLLNVTNRTM